jgi:hypothetical protein
MHERGPRRQAKATVDDPYTKPWVARDAAKNVVKEAVFRGQTPADMIDQEYGIFRPDYAAVVGRFAAVTWHQAPVREIARDEIGVTGFAPEGEIFPLSEIWQEVTGKAMPPYQPSLVPEKPVRRRRKGGAP